MQRLELESSSLLTPVESSDIGANITPSRKAFSDHCLPQSPSPEFSSFILNTSSVELTILCWNDLLRSLLFYSSPPNISNTVEAPHSKYPRHKWTEGGIIRLTKRGGMGPERGHLEYAGNNSLSFHNLVSNRLYIFELKVQCTVNLLTFYNMNSTWNNSFSPSRPGNSQISGSVLYLLGSQVTVASLGSGERGAID